MILRALGLKSPLAAVLEGAHSPQMTVRFEQTLMERRYVTGTELHRANMDPEALLARLPLGKDARVLDNARACLRDISELNRFSEALSKTTIKYDWDNPAHEKLLDEFWQLLRPGVARAGGRGAAEWEQLGFTCHEPSQDLRGFGLLALTNMVTFARRHTDKARRILEETHKLPNHFSYAPACVNTTHYLYQQTLNHKIGLVYYKRGGSGSPEFFQKLFDVAFERFSEYYKKKGATCEDDGAVLRSFAEELPSIIADV